MIDALVVMAGFGFYMFVILIAARVIGFSERDDRE